MPNLQFWSQGLFKGAILPPIFGTHQIKYFDPRLDKGRPRVFRKDQVCHRAGKQTWKFKRNCLGVMALAEQLCRALQDPIMERGYTATSLTIKRPCVWKLALLMKHTFLPGCLITASCKLLYMELPAKSVLSLWQVRWCKLWELYSGNSYSDCCRRYDSELNDTLGKAARASTIDEARSMSGDVNIQYKSQEHYETLTERLGILREWKVREPQLLHLLFILGRCFRNQALAVHCWIIKLILN